MRLVMGVSLALVLAGTVHAQGPELQSQVVAAHQAYYDAFIRGDADTMATHEAADFMLMDNGAVAPGRSPHQHPKARPNREQNAAYRGAALHEHGQ